MEYNWIMDFLKSKRALTNADLTDEKKLERYLKTLAVTERKKFLKRYLEMLKEQVLGSKRRLAKYTKKLDTLK